MWIIENEGIWQSIINQNGEMEFDWLGIDKNGHIAIFSNFNSGYTPNSITKSLTLYNELAVFIEELDKTSDAINVHNGKGKYDDWEEYAQKGIFAYDNENIHTIGYPNRYHLIFKPKKPINYKEISDLKKFETIIPVFNIEFIDFLSFEELKNSLK